MHAARRSRGLAAVAGTLALAGSTAALMIAPGVSAAATVHNCGNKTLAVEVATAPSTPPQKFKVTVDAIRVQGISCQGAYKFLTALYERGPGKYKCVTGHFKAPPGKVPDICTRPGVKIQFAGQGG